jgi:hypothetical protein
VLPNSWKNRKQGTSKLRIKEMGSRYLFIILYCWLERVLSRDKTVSAWLHRITAMQQIVEQTTPIREERRTAAREWRTSVARQFGLTSVSLVKS